MKTAILISLMLILSGCTNLTIDLYTGTKIVYQKCFMDASAEKVDFFYQDPNVCVWLVTNDPNSEVSPGRFTIIEPNTGINITVESVKE